MADILNEAFGEDGFDPISWINNACNNKATDEPLEKFLAELEMRLQLNAEDIEATLSDNSAQAMRRIPFAIQEIYRLQGDIQGMQDQVQVLAGSVQRDATDARGSVEHISQLHLVKANMENACNSLKEATELSGLFVKVEEVFAAGDLPKVAEILASMRRSLSLVGDVPEFRAGEAPACGGDRQCACICQVVCSGCVGCCAPTHHCDTPKEWGPSPATTPTPHIPPRTSPPTTSYPTFNTKRQAIPVCHCHPGNRLMTRPPRPDATTQAARSCARWRTGCRRRWRAAWARRWRGARTTRPCASCAACCWRWTGAGWGRWGRQRKAGAAARAGEETEGAGCAAQGGIRIESRARGGAGTATIRRWARRLVESGARECVPERKVD